MCSMTSGRRSPRTSSAWYPGSFSDRYRWQDGVGPPDDRPRHERQYRTDFEFSYSMPPGLPEQFGPVETNEFGTDEFLQYCLDLDVDPMLVANFGSGTPAEAAAWVACTNTSGHAPRPVQWWGMGNETYGWWEIGQCEPDEYARRYLECATAMKAVDPTIRLLAVGETRRPGQPSGAWNREVLATVAEAVDALSVRWYFPGPGLGRRSVTTRATTCRSPLQRTSLAGPCTRPSPTAALPPTGRSRCCSTSGACEPCWGTEPGRLAWWSRHTPWAPCSPSRSNTTRNEE